MGLTFVSDTLALDPLLPAPVGRLSSAKNGLFVKFCHSICCTIASIFR
jgi:hypothetical protein